MKILANDGIDKLGKRILEDAGHTVITEHLSMEELELQINQFDALIVRSATKVRSTLIDRATRLRVIGRAGVGMDNIDVDYARSKGIAVYNTPAASSRSVAELVFAHLMGGVRFLYDAQRRMPVTGYHTFSALKSTYAKGTELAGKTLGIVGFGRIGQEVARIGLGMGMDVLVHDKLGVPNSIDVQFSGGTIVQLPVQTCELRELYQRADFITFHVPSMGEALLDAEDFTYLKPGVGIVNTARGGIVDEDALIVALDNGQVAFAGLDVFVGEPTPKQQLLAHPKVSLSPHIGAATIEAQQRVGEELASAISDFLEAFSLQESAHSATL